jgi:iron complex outermembrane recepter protein
MKKRPFAVIKPSPVSAAAVLGMLLVLPGTTPAETTTSDSAQKDNQLEQIIVTASKREQNLERVGTAVTALSESQLVAMGKSDLTAVTNRVPGMQFNQYAPTLTVFNIRGVSQNDFTDAQEAPVAYYSDGVYVSALGAISGQMYDLSRVEVLRGPQGTLFGRNATGGLVQTISALPTPEFSGYLQAAAGSYGEYTTEGAVSGPLSDSVRTRLSFMTDDSQGYVHDVVSGLSLGTARAYAVRSQFDFDLPNADNLLVKFYVTRNDHERPADYYTVPSYPNQLGLGVILPPNVNYWHTCPGCDILGYRSPYLNDPYTIAINHLPSFTRTYFGGTATYTGSLFGQKLTSITSYQGLRKDYSEDSDGTPQTLDHYFVHQYFTQESQELRLEGTTDRLFWVAGLYGLAIDSNNGYSADLSGLGAEDYYKNQTHTHSGAVFGQIEYKLRDDVKLITGIRGSYDHKEYSYYIEQLATGSPAESVLFDSNTYPSLATESFKNWSGKLEVDYTPSEDALLYASVNRGTKAGGFASPGSIPNTVSQLVNALPFNQEVLTSYEGGLKLTMFNGSTRLNAAVFHYNYEHYQAFSVIGIFSEITNNDAQVNGGELELTTTPVNGLVLNGFVSLLRSRVYDIVAPSGAIINPEMPQSPHYSLGSSADYTLPTSVGSFKLSGDWKYNAPEYWEIFNAPADREPGEGWGDARLAFVPASNNKWEFAVSVKNVTNKVYHIYASDISGISFEQFTMARPRWVLVSARRDF